MPLIRETLVVTRSADGGAHVTPMGAQYMVLADGTAGVLLQPFRPSTTHDNLLRQHSATLNHVDDVRIFAGCITGRRVWSVVPAERIAGTRLEAALAHEELEVVNIEDDPLRPRICCRLVHQVNHTPFPGFNRAKAAVIEAAILVSRLGMLPLDQVDREIAYLGIAVGKTAGPPEQEAWNWLMSAIETFRSNQQRRLEMCQ